MVDPMISVRDLWKVYGPRAERIVGSPEADLPRGELQAKLGNVVAMREVSLDVAPGEVFVVMGLSGSGKSTLIRCITRLIEPTAGKVIIEGQDVTAATDDALLAVRRHKVSMVFQHFGLLPHRTLLDNVAFGLELGGVGKPQRRETAAQAVQPQRTHVDGLRLVLGQRIFVRVELVEDTNVGLGLERVHRVGQRAGLMGRDARHRLAHQRVERLCAPGLQREPDHQTELGHLLLLGISRLFHVEGSSPEPRWRRRSARRRCAARAASPRSGW